MKSSLMLIGVVAVCTGVALGAEPAPPNEHLTGFGPFIGTWRYEGPSPEEVPGFAQKDSTVVIQLSWRWILEKTGIMQDLLVKFEGSKQISQKDLIGWNAADQTIVCGGMSSIGVMHLGTIQLDPQAKTWTVVTEGVNAEGNKASSKAVLKKVDKDTLTFERLELTGNVVEGASPVYTFKRVEPAKGKKSAR